ncbi:XRE family transcriptional regulator [Sphaerisporangium album]|uniref:XRE family transcriptional regulator n=1 Tax=Sphaerisporangium album TaxID=509200 RepID=A0A367FHL6_9ACTN|nr:helix-turn-helix transcriptional regulator [Sphaerisporangium album]RCG29821.1 XRE family transcriptional regulator [Sphaerisporangium album]
MDENVKNSEPPLPPGSPQARFGAEMRRLREAKQWSQAAVAARLGCTQTQVSRLEMAKRTPSRSDAEKLDLIFGHDERNYFVGLYRRITARPGGPRWFMDWVDQIEPYALVLRSWDPLLIPGLLQTESYARHIFSQGPRLTSKEVEDRVAARMQRQGILDRDDSPTLLALIDQGVLHRLLGDAKLMREQLDHLIEIAQHPAVSIQIVDSQCVAGLLGAFMIAELPHGEPDTIHADSSTEGQITDDPEVVASVWNRYESIRLWAYPEHVSIKMIKEAGQEWT